MGMSFPDGTMFIGDTSNIIGGGYWSTTETEGFSFPFRWRSTREQKIKKRGAGITRKLKGKKRRIR